MSAPTRIALAISCPRCGSAIGTGCRNERGRPTATHAERIARYRAIVGDSKPKRRRKAGGRRRPSTRPRPGPVTIRRLDTGEAISIVSQRSIRSGRKPKPQPEPRRSSPELEIPPWRLEER